MSAFIIVITVAVLAFGVVCALLSINVIGPTEVGLVQKRFSFRKLREDNPVAFHGEAGYQAELLTAGWRVAGPLLPGPSWADATASHSNSVGSRAPV